MTRPTKGEVDAALEHYYDEAACAIERRCSDVLAGEVVALRLEAENASAEHEALWNEHREALGQLAQLRGKVSRCESHQQIFAKLAESWAADTDPHHEIFARTYEFVAGELESCLRSVP